jgi:hypothetical protein
MPPRAAVQEPMRHCLEGDMRKASRSHGPQTPDQPKVSTPSLSLESLQGNPEPFTCCREHISAISEGSRGFGRISLSFPRAFNKLLPPCSDCWGCRHAYTHARTRTHTHTHTTHPGWRVGGDRSGLFFQKGLLSLPHPPSRCSVLQSLAATQGQG